MSDEKIPFTFNLPYNQPANYWLAVFCRADAPEFIKTLEALGMQRLHSTERPYVMRCADAWEPSWKTLREAIARHALEEQVEASLLTGETQPDGQEFIFARKPVNVIDNIAGSLWLGDALLDDRIVCYMQPVLDKRGKIFGYEAFARMEAGDRVIGGGQTIEAARCLNAEYMLDRYLHLKAIRTFITSDLDGFLFINLIPGFIHRPEKYLEGLSDAAKFNGMAAKQIVLDFTHSETPRDIAHLKAIFDYCRSKGYLLSLDDISSVAVAKKILETVHPDFIKLDVDLVNNSAGLKEQRAISELVTVAHASGATLIAEGVETEAIHHELLKAGIDLFQGYFFSPPVAVSRLKKIVG
jgi:EAL domain-containing protein (putative c-di-GMP-specific phosphodiesterase class I)